MSDEESVVPKLMQHVRTGYSVDGQQRVHFDRETAVAILLIRNVLFINNFWWMKDEGWPESATKMISLNVNVNDVVAWGCADAIELEYSEIQDLYEHWERDQSWGSAVWYCKKIKMFPQKPVADLIRAQGIWDLDNMGLEK